MQGFFFFSFWEVKQAPPFSLSNQKHPWHVIVRSQYGYTHIPLFIVTKWLKPSLLNIGDLCDVTLVPLMLLFNDYQWLQIKIEGGKKAEKASLFGGSTGSVATARHHHLQDWRRTEGDGWRATDGGRRPAYSHQATKARHIFPQL